MKSDASQGSKIWLAYAGLVLTVFFWSVNTVLARGMVFTIKPMALSFFRWMTALVCILPFSAAAVKRDWPEIRKHTGYLFVLSIFSVALYNSVLYLGAQFTTAINISLVIAAMPGITLLFVWMIIRERPQLLQTIGIGVSLAGVLIIVCKGSLSVLLGLTFNPGDILIILSISSWALYSVLLKKRDIRISPIALLTVLIVMGLVCIFPFYLLEYKVYQGFELNKNTVLLFAFLGIFPSIVSYICWNYGVKITGSSTAAIFMYLIPVFTSLLAWLFLDEQLFSYHFTGGILILAGLLMSSKGHKKPES